MIRHCLAAFAFWMGLVSPIFAQNNTWPPPAGFQAIYPPVGAVVINCGGSIASGGTAQQLFTAAQYRMGFIIEVGTNDSNTDSIYFSDGPTTTTPGVGVAGSWSLAPSTSSVPGGSWTSPPNFPVGVAYFINGATTGDKFKCRVW